MNILNKQSSFSFKLCYYYFYLYVICILNFETKFQTNKFQSEIYYHNTGLPFFIKHYCSALKNNVFCRYFCCLFYLKKKKKQNTKYTMYYANTYRY